jgi:hypothetical protein
MDALGKAADWRVSKGSGASCTECRQWIAIAPGRAGLALAVCNRVTSAEVVFVVFMVESFHRMSPLSPL